VIHLPLCQHRSTRYDGPGYTACIECQARFAKVGGPPPPSYANRNQHRRVTG
jgi:hypothetical protein